MADDYEFDASEYDDDLDLSDEHDLDDEAIERWKDDGFPAPTLIRFHYKNDLDHETDRVVEVQRFTSHGPYLSILGHCRQRNALREFRGEWITDCTDEQTGKPIEDLHNHLFNLYEKTPAYSFDQVAAKHTDTLRASIHLAGCAGFSEADQISIIRQICHQLSGDKRISAEPVSCFLAQYSGSQASGVDQTFRLIAGRLNKSLSANNKEAVIRLCTKIAGMKGPINTGSQESIDYLTKRFSKPE